MGWWEVHVLALLLIYFLGINYGTAKIVKTNHEWICKAYSTPDYGTVQYLNKTNTMGAKLVITCQDGYRLKGPGVKRCEAIPDPFHKQVLWMPGETSYCLDETIFEKDTSNEMHTRQSRGLHQEMVMTPPFLKYDGSINKPQVHRGYQRVSYMMPEACFSAPQPITEDCPITVETWEVDEDTMDCVPSIACASDEEHVLSMEQCIEKCLGEL